MSITTLYTAKGLMLLIAIEAWEYYEAQQWVDYLIFSASE